MSITQDGLISGGKVGDSGSFFLSKEARKARKFSMLDIFLLGLGLFLLAMATTSLILGDFLTVTEDTGYSTKTRGVSIAVTNYVLAFYNIQSALSRRFVSPSYGKKVYWATIPMLAFAIFLMFFPVFDKPSLNYGEWAGARYGISEVESDLEDGAAVSYVFEDQKKVATVKKIDREYFLYDPATDKELPLIDR